MSTVLDILVGGMAEANMEIAIDLLRELAESDPKKLGISEKDYCRKLNESSMYVHSRVRRYGPSAQRIRWVKKEIIPLLERAYKKITAEGKFFDDLRANVKWRGDELRVRYCNGLECVIPQDVLQRALSPAYLSQ